MKMMSQATNGKTRFPIIKRTEYQTKMILAILTSMIMQKITIWKLLVNMLSMPKNISWSSKICQSRSSSKYSIRAHISAKINTTWPFSTRFCSWFLLAWPFSTIASTPKNGTDSRKKTRPSTSLSGRWTWLLPIAQWSVFITFTIAKMELAACFARCLLTSC